jgi:formylglycine-generating enzyme required for sulfatase activity
MAAIRIFISHSSHDNVWCRDFVAGLQAAGWDVWYDEKGLSGGSAWLATIQREIEGHDAFLLVLTPEAWASRWVREELDLALATHRQILPVLYKPTQVEGFIRTRQWIDVVGLPSPAAAAKVSAALGAPAQPASVSPPRAGEGLGVGSIPPDRFPPRLAQLGYQGRVLNDIEVILPPLCSVPAGAFLMGSDPSQDKETQDNEKPQHWVALPDFQIARYPVTVAEYGCFVRTGHAEPKSQYNPLTWQQQRERPDHPVVNVSWKDVVAYATWLATQTGQPWRLPSEAEWEKAARWDPATRTSRIYPWGDNFDTSRANTRESGKKTTTPVGTYPSGASPCGAQDMAGNVWEWTSSHYKPYPYNASDGRETLTSTENRVLRGGSCVSIPRNSRAAYRSIYHPDYAFYFVVGVRLAWAVPNSGR